MAMPWTTLARALPYGYGLYWLVRIEGIPGLFVELAADAVAPAGFVLDASLVIDRSARLGSVIEGSSHIAKGFDLEVRLLATSFVDSVFRTPTRLTTLAEDLDAASTAAVVGSSSDWSGSELHIGTSCMPFSGTAFGMFTGLDRATYGRARSYRKGAVVASNPYHWQGRQVDLFAVLLDPSGRYVQQNDILSSAAMMWSGYVAERPVRDGTEWVLVAQDQVRRLANPLGVAASGKVVWVPEDDVEVEVRPATRVGLKLAMPATGTIFSAEVSPWSGYVLGDRARLSQLRQAIVDALTAANTSAAVLGFRWRVRTEGYDRGMSTDRQVYELAVNVDPAAGDVWLEVHAWCSATNYLIFTTGGGREALNPASAGEERSCWIFQETRIHSLGLGVLLDKGAASDIPTTGVVLLEGGGRADYARYTNAEQDRGDSGRVNLTLDPSTRIAGQDLMAVLNGERADVSARFLWSDAGSAADVLRRVLASTGDGVHGSYDTLPRGQGLGLPMLDEASFDRVFAGLYRDLHFELAVDSGTSVAAIFGDLLKLSRRAILTRRSSDGARVDVAACDVGPLDGGSPAVTISDAKLVTIRGRRPLRVRDSFAVPQAIEVTCHTIPVGEAPASEGVARFVGQHLTDWTRQAWELAIHGIPRSVLLGAGRAWALAWFRGGETRQIIEVDVPPWEDAQAGDIVEVSLDDPSVWDYATGTPGYRGLGRVLGSQLDLTSAVLTLRVAVDGILGPGPMCPSLPIVAVNGSATSPNSIDVDEDYYSLLVAAKDGNSSWRMVAYLPGFDHPRGEYVLSSISLTGGGVARLTVTSSPSSPTVTLTTSHRLTFPVTSTSTNNQRRHLHTDQRVQWS